MNLWEHLQEKQLDALKEIGNIGAGNAATSLSQLLGKPVQMKVPHVHVVSLDEATDRFDSSDEVVAAVLLRIDGDLTGNMFFILPKHAAKKLLTYMLEPQAHDDQEIFNEVELSTLQEVGNILCGSYLSALADLTQLNIYPTVPSMATDMVTAILSYGLVEFGMFGDFAVVIETQFIDPEGESNDLDGHFFLLPDPDSFRKLFQAIGVPLNE